MLEGIGPKLVLIFVIGIVIILIGVGIGNDIFSTQTRDNSLNIHSIGEVIDSPENYIGQKITVNGYYYQDDLPDGEGYIASEQVPQPILEGTLDNIDFLLMNFSAVNITLNESIMYDFTGTLIQQENAVYNTTGSVILFLENVEIY